MLSTPDFFAITFWVSAAALGYIAAGYPLVLFALGLFFKKTYRIDDAHRPFVTMAISAFNEEAVIGAKLDNALALDYPLDRLQIVVVSDGSTDRTEEIVRERAARDSRIELFAVRPNAGKTAALNAALSSFRNEIVVFTDADSMYRPDALLKLVRRFADPRVGVACGELRYERAEDGSARGESGYWKFDIAMKKLESGMGTMLGSNGSIFAARRDLVEPVHPANANDMTVPILIAQKGRAVLYEPEAVCTETLKPGSGFVMRRKSRIISQGIFGCFYLYRRMLRPVRPLLWLELTSRKFLKYFMFLFVVGALAGALGAAGVGPVYAWAAGAQAAFYGLALLGFLPGRPFRSARPFRIPHYFLLVQTGAFLGAVKFFTGRVDVSWRSERAGAEN